MIETFAAVAMVVSVLGIGTVFKMANEGDVAKNKKLEVYNKPKISSF